MRAAENNFGQFSSDRCGNGADGFREAPGGDGGVARSHKDDHGFAHGAAESENETREHAWESGRQNDLPGNLPGSGAEGSRGVALFARHGGERVFHDSEHDRNHGKSEGNAGVDGIQAVIEIKNLLDPTSKDDKRKKTQHDRRDSGEELNRGLDDFADPARSEFRAIDGRENGKWRGKEHSHECDFEGPEEERQQAVLGYL